MSDKNTHQSSASLREAAQNALVTLDGIADANPRDTADFETPAEWIAWAKSRARFAADALRAPVAQEVYAERILKQMLQAEKKCSTCGFIGQEDPVKGCPKCGFDDMQPKLQAPQAETAQAARQYMSDGHVKTDPEIAAANGKALSLMIEQAQAGELPDERGAFERFAQNCPMGRYSINRRGDGYDSSHTQIMWDAWQARAARASQVKQSGELPPLPKPEISGIPLGMPMSIGNYIRPSKDLFTADQMHAYARAALAARKPLTGLTREQMEAGRHQVFSTNNPFCPCDSKTFRKVSEWTEREFCRINGLEVK